jgi:drug/metabolite transporter (DMT)-like permease
MHTGLAIGAALGSAACFAISSVLQQRGASRCPEDSGMKLLLELLKSPIWVGGLVTAALTLVLQAVALAVGELALIQPLMLLGLLFALPVSVLLEKCKPSMQEWAWAALLVVGLTIFLRAAKPTAGPPLADDWQMLKVGGIALLLTGLAIGLGYGPGSRHRAALLGLATGITYGISAALIKYSYGLADDGGISRLLTSWPLYALIIVGGGGIMLNQAAYRSGPLAGALPPLAITDPMVAIIFGVIAFGEKLSSTGSAIALQALGFGLVALAIVRLARNAAGRSAQDPYSADEIVPTPAAPVRT